MRWVLVPLLLLAACGSEEAAPCDSSPTWVDDIAPIAERTCLPCHSSELVGTERRGAPEGVNFNTYPDGVEALTAFAEDFTSGRMPPEGSDIETMAPERAAVNRWVQCGFPQGQNLQAE